MNILITNDDGFDAPGLVALYHAVRALGTVHVVAPREEQSGCSHRLTLRGSLSVERRTHDSFGEGFAVDGTPADCVRLAAAQLVPEPLDLVVAGINRGANAGVAPYYSGTIAAAREGALQRIHAISVSQSVRQGVELDWEATSQAAALLIPKLAAEELPGPGFWSVNLPAPLPDDLEASVRRVPVASAPMPVEFNRQGDGRGEHLEFKAGSWYWDREVDGPCDYAVIRDGGIAVTAIPLFGRF